jgi:hypothetical protein
MPIPMISLTNHNKLVKMDPLPLTSSVTASSLVKAINVNRKFQHIPLQMFMPPRKKYILKLKFSSCNFQSQVHISEPQSHLTCFGLFKSFALPIKPHFLSHTLCLTQVCFPVYHPVYANHRYIDL